ncbi:hypothetical protein GGI00_004007 [Coemansia sp. RSA 2681]|nr:hypothetical protein GGI00_004007 [Coemansia sp. RSA 2681]
MALIKHSFVAVSLAIAASSVAEIVEVGYAPQTMVVAQQYSVNKANYMRGDALEAHIHVRAGEDSSENGNSEDIRGSLEERDMEDLELSSSEIRDNAATSPSHFTLTAGSGSSVLTLLLAAGSVWAAAF